MRSHLMFFILFCFNRAICERTALNLHYYWRDYTGRIPADAVPGGLDSNNKTTYIGQGFVKDHGILHGVIYPGKMEIVAAIYGTTKIDSYIKILCSPYNSAFNWVTVTSKNFHTEMINKFPVKGGLEDGYIFNIGRVAYQGETVTGKIVTSWPETATMYFVYKDQEKSVTSYEVLLYDDAATMDYIFSD